MFQHVRVATEPLARFFQSVAAVLRTTDHKVVRDVIQSGISTGRLKVFKMEDQWWVGNTDAPEKGATVSRLVREVVEAWRLSKRLDNPNASANQAIDYMSKIPFSLNEMIMDLLMKQDELPQMEQLLVREYSTFGSGPFYLPVFYDHRGRLYSKGSVGNYQMGDVHRSACDFEESFQCSNEDLQFLADKIRREWGLDESQIRDALKDPTGFLKASKVKKPWLCLRYCFGINDIESTGKTSLILQSDLSCSGGQVVAFITGDLRLAKFTNMVPNKANVRQDVYRTMAAIAKGGNLLGDRLGGMGNGIFYERPTSKGIGVPALYCASPASAAQSLILADDKVKLQYLDRHGCYNGALEGLDERYLNKTFLPVWRELGWEEAVSSSMHIAQAYTETIFGSKRVSGVSLHLRKFMQACKRLVEAAGEGNNLSWELPDGFVAHNSKVGCDVSAPSYPQESFHVPIPGQEKGMTVRVRVAPLVWEGSTHAGPPNMTHSLDSLVNRSFILIGKGMGVPVAQIHDSGGLPVSAARQAPRLWKGAYLTLPETYFDDLLKKWNVDVRFGKGLNRDEFAKTRLLCG